MSEPTPATPTTTDSVPSTVKPDAPAPAPAPATAPALAPAPATEPVPVTGGKRKTKKNGGKSRKGRKLNGPARAWTDLVSQVFKDGKAKNPNYKFKQALKDASKLKKKNKTAKK
jgi:hypothetical protein